MAKLTRIRDKGAIPERRHDAFLLALLLAVSINIAFFAVQALIPKIASLLQALGPEAAAPKEETGYPFILVNDALEDEELDPELQPDAMSDRTREARQVEEQPDLPEEKPYEEVGVDELLSSPTGNPGPAEMSPQNTPGEVAAEPSPDDEETPSENEEPMQAEESPETDEFQDLPEMPEVAERPEMPELPELPDFPETPEPPEPIEQQEPPPEPIPEPPPQEMPEQEPLPEPPPEPFILPIPEPEETPESPAAEHVAEAPLPSPEPVEELQEIDPDPYADPSADLIDLASLPISPDGFYDPQTQLLEEIAQRAQTMPQQQPAWREDPQENYLSQPYMQPQAYQQAQPNAQPERPRSSRQGSSSVPMRRIGGASAAGGTPPQRNRSSSVNLLDSDSNMRILTHRYGAYMRKLQRQLQESLNRVVYLNPTSYSQGGARIRFSIAPDGSLAVYMTDESTSEAVRMISESTLREGAPFDPPTQQMLQDPLFQKMTLTVNLY